MVAFTGADTPGGVITVVQKGEVLFEKAYGMANLVHAVPFTTATPSNLGSTSKQFTAFAIALLEKEGKLSLDDDVRKHIPEVPDFGETVTLRNLLTHTSGYREFLNTLGMARPPAGRGGLHRSRRVDRHPQAPAEAAEQPGRRVQLQQHRLRPADCGRRACDGRDVSRLDEGERVHSRSA